MPDLNTKEYTVTISKTVQERQYEPITVTLTTSGACPIASLEVEQDAAYQQLKAKIQAIFNPPGTSTPPGPSIPDEPWDSSTEKWL